MVWVPFNAEYASTVGETISSVVQQVSMHVVSGSSAGFIQCGIWPACPHLVVYGASMDPVYTVRAGLHVPIWLSAS